MSAVDVLAVMKRCHHQSASHPNGSVALESESFKAIAAVAELMEAHATLLAQVDAGTSADYRALQETAVVRRSRTALARCGK